MGHETAILVVSFGTTYMDTLERSIVAVERAVAESYPEYAVYRAFLSSVVIRRLKEKYNLQVDNVAEALARIGRDGYRQIVIQPTLLLRGVEYELLAKEIENTEIRVSIGRPLLENRQDCEALVSIIIEENPLEEGEALVLMGHGTEHETNVIYHEIQEIFAEKGYPAFICTMNGAPSFEEAVEHLSGWGARRARLLPLMFVAGAHAKNNMAGEEDSLLCAVRGAGIMPEPVFRGLGEGRSVQLLYVERVREAMVKLFSGI